MKRQEIPAPLGRGVCQKDVVAFAVGEGGRFVKVRPAVIVDIEVDLPVGNWDFSGIGAAVGVEVVVFGAADATDLEVANVDVADVYLAGGSDVVDRFGHGVAEGPMNSVQCLIKKLG